MMMTDVESLFAIYVDKEAMKFRGTKPFQTIEDAEKYVKEKDVNVCGTITNRQAVSLEDTNELIGSIMFRYQEENNSECEIGYSIGRKFWGQGYGFQIIKMMIQVLLEKPDLKTIKAWSNKENLASIKILEKAGFVRVDQPQYDESFLYMLSVRPGDDERF